MRYLPLLVLCAAACVDSAPTALPRSLRASEMQSQGITPMSAKNMYVGADLDAVIAALVSPDPSDDLPALLTGIQTLGVTDYPARAGGYAAAEIARARPDVVGLQEVSKIDITISGLVDLHLDFLPLLLDSLAARGVTYVPASSVLNIVATPVPGIELHDFDVMLVHPNRVAVTEATGNSYAGQHRRRGPRRGAEARVRDGAGERRGVRRSPLRARTSSLGTRRDFLTCAPRKPSELVGALPHGRACLRHGRLQRRSGLAGVSGRLQRAGLVDTWAALKPHPASAFTCCRKPRFLGTQTPAFKPANRLRLDVHARLQRQCADRAGG